MLKTTKSNDKLVIRESYNYEGMMILLFILATIIKIPATKDITTFLDVLNFVVILVFLLIFTLLIIGYSNKIIFDRVQKTLTVSSKKMFKKSKYEIKMNEIKEILLIRNVVERNTRASRYRYCKYLSFVDINGKVTTLIKITYHFLHYFIHKDAITNIVVLISEYTDIPIRVEDTD